MDRKTWLAISLCFLIYVGWQKFYLEPRTLPPGAPQNQLATQSQAPSTSAQTQATTATTTGTRAATNTAPAVPKQTFNLNTATGTALLGNGGDFLENWQIKNYHLTQTTNAASVDLNYVTNEANQVQLAFDDPEFSYLTSVSGTFSPVAGGVLWTYEDAKVKLTREFKSSDSQPFISTKITADFKSKKPAYAFVSLTSKSVDKDPEAQDRQFIYWTNNSVERVHIVEKKVEIKDITTNVKYIAASNRYFLLSLVNDGDLEARGLIQPTSLNASSGRISLRYMLQGNSITIPLRVYFGPKEIDLLRSVDPSLNHVVDFGFFEIFAYPLLKLLKWLDQFVRNYGVAIILLTILLKLVTYPLTYKSMKSMKEMAKLQPQLAKIREKHKDDKEALNREMMSVMKTHGYNPVAGCLPMLIQMPVFFALYRVLYGSIELYQAPFALWIQDLSRPDHFYVTPVLLSATMFIQQKLTPNTATDPAQQKMMQFMPLIFGAFMLTLPAGLTLYMLTNALASIAQQMILNKKLDPARAGNAVAVAR